MDFDPDSDHHWNWAEEFEEAREAAALRASFIDEHPEFSAFWEIAALSPRTAAESTMAQALNPNSIVLPIDSPFDSAARAGMTLFEAALLNPTLSFAQEWLQILVSHKDIPKEQLSSIAHWACASGTAFGERSALLPLLFSAGADPAWATSSDETSLLALFRSVDAMPFASLDQGTFLPRIPALLTLLDLGADPGRPNASGEFPLSRINARLADLQNLFATDEVQESRRDLLACAEAILERGGDPSQVREYPPLEAVVRDPDYLAMLQAQADKSALLRAISSPEPAANRPAGGSRPSRGL